MEILPVLDLLEEKARRHRGDTGEWPRVLVVVE